MQAQLQKQVVFGDLSIDDGLSQNSVVSIAQDSIGYLWFATQDGLNKYDGNRFEYFPKLFEDITRENFSRLGKVYVAPNGWLYIITIGGQLELFDSEENTFIPMRWNRQVNTVYTDQQHTMWLGTIDSGLYQVAKESKDTLAILKGADVGATIYNISEHENEIVATGSGGVFLINRNTLDYERISLKNGAETNFSSVARLKSDTLAIGSFGQGLYLLNSKEKELIQFHGFDAKNPLPTDLNIQALLRDSRNRLWIGTYGNGAFRIDFSKEEILNFTAHTLDQRSISYNDIISLAEDYTGVVWLGTDGGGLSYYDEHISKFNELTNFQVPSFANVDVARAIIVDDAGMVWIGTSGKGLTQYNPNKNKFNAYKTDGTPSLASDRVMSLLSKEASVWIGFQDAGLALLENNVITHFTENTVPQLPAQTVWCIYKDRKERVWLGTRENGLIQFDKDNGVVQQFTVPFSEDSSNNIRAITEDSEGYLWLGTEDRGLIKFHPETQEYVLFQQSELLKVKSIYYQDEYVWVGTNGNGLQVLNTQTEAVFGYTTDDGLPNNVIYGILPDDNGNFWLSSNRGITKFSLKAADDIPEITNYDKNDGIQAMEFNTGASYVGADGTLYFGGLNGINWFRPEDLTGNPVPPRTVITQMELYAEPIQWRTEPVFNSEENTLTFNFAGLHYSQPESNQYQFILENYEEGWSKPNSNRFAHYPNLPFGSYTFKVLSSNYEGIWDDTPAAYSFTIKAPWYLSQVAIWGYILGSILLFWTIYRYMKWRWSIQLRLRIEHDEAERLRRLDELKSKLYTNISHEFRTPLTLISGPTQQLMASANLDSKDQKSLKLIEGSSKRMLRLVNQLLDLSKLEQGSVQLRVEKQVLKPQLEQLLEAFALKAKEKGVSIASEIKVDRDTWYDRDVVEKIVSNLLYNAVKYAPANSGIQLAFTVTGDLLNLKTTNQNKNLTTKDIERLFDRFYQANKKEEGLGVGLALIKELTSFSGGTVIALKKTPDTITFAVEIPIDPSLYPKKCISTELITSVEAKSEPMIHSELENEEAPQLLIVEDNAEIRSFISSLFEETFIVQSAVNGQDGIDKALESIPDLIISDIMMPVKSGIALCNELKKDTRTSHIPIFLLTAKSTDTSELEGLQSKANDYITKPFNSEVLQQKVANCINAHRKLRERYHKSELFEPKDIAFTSVDEAFLNDVQSVLDDKLTNSEFNAEKFARTLHMSRMQLHRKLKALTGLSTSEFIRSQRLKAAIQLLGDSGFTINEIAYTVGFNTTSYFTKCFKETYGITPGEYTKK